MRDASSFLRDNYEEFEDGVEALMEIAGDSYNETEADLATYFLIKKELPELLNNRYLQDFRERCEMCIEEINQKSSPSATLSSAAACNVLSRNRENGPNL